MIEENFPELMGLLITKVQTFWPFPQRYNWMLHRLQKWTN